MADYFLLLDESLFEKEMRPTLAASWRLRSFEPCRPFCAALMPRVERFTARYHVAEGESLPAQVVRGLPFDRAYWRSLVGELLFYAADDVPEFQTAPDTLGCLLAPEHRPECSTSRVDLSPIQQAHYGTRDLTFGSAIYRPDHCGLNALDDVRRLADYLTGIDSDAWQSADLALLLAEEDERAEELAFARDWFPSLRDTYRRAAEHRQIVVHERL